MQVVGVAEGENLQEDAPVSVGWLEWLYFGLRVGFKLNFKSVA